ncbi:MAG: cobalamin biosynthesis central domain-containing protein, partial [Thermincolia bacterium]
MSTAIIVLTAQGVKTAKRAKDHLTLQGSDPIHLYLPEKLMGLLEAGEARVYQGPLREVVEKIFHQYRALICVMALGIVVRLIGPLAANKGEDPAVVTLDEKGQFVISVLSGHLGGANQLAGQLAEALGATAVITTATDVQGKTAIDVLARQWGMGIEPLASIKIVNGALLEDKQVTVFHEGDLPGALPESYLAIPFSSGENREGLVPTVYISNKIIPSAGERTLFLRP